jgi:hypothetical protein
MEIISAEVSALKFHQHKNLTLEKLFFVVVEIIEKITEKWPNVLELYSLLKNFVDSSIH